MKEYGRLGAQGNWTNRLPTEGEAFVRRQANKNHQRHRRLGKIIASRALSTQARVIKATLGSALDLNPEVTNWAFATSAKLLKNVPGYDFTKHEILDLRNNDLDLTNEALEAPFDYLIFVPGSLGPPIYGQGVALSRASNISHHTAVLNGPTVHTDPVSVISAADTITTRLREMIDYVKPNQKVLIMGHSLGGVLFQLAFSALTKDEQIAILGNWELQFASVGSPQISNGPEIFEFLKVDRGKDDLSQSFKTMLKSPELIAHFGKIELERIITQWQEHDFDSAFDVKMQLEATRRHISLTMERDIIVPRSATQAESPAKNVEIGGGEHLGAIFVDTHKWRQGTEAITDHGLQL